MKVLVFLYICIMTEYHVSLGTTVEGIEETILGLRFVIDNFEVNDISLDCETNRIILIYDPEKEDDVTESSDEEDSLYIDKGVKPTYIESDGDANRMTDLN